ncbi:hypothetical protein GmHk_17G047617 [Glycine max]|nr:hypothetical protein GmHk_17G047617 [Glycine max]
MNPSLTSSSTLSSSSSSWFSGIVRVGRSNSVKMSNNSAAAPSSDTAGPVVRKNQFRGVLFKYGPNPIQVAFKTGDFKRQVLRHAKYLEPLAIALDHENWSLVQFLMSSSYSGYGTSSLQQCQTAHLRFLVAENSVVCLINQKNKGQHHGLSHQDAKELDQLINYLINKEDSEGVALLGHSTGCQDIVHYMRTNFACSRAVRAAIFQAPVSDREYQATLPHTASMIDLAAKMISEGRGLELMPREADPSAPITAYRENSIEQCSGFKRKMQLRAENKEIRGDKLHDPVAGGTQNCQIDFLPLISSLQYHLHDMLMDEKYLLFAKVDIDYTAKRYHSLCSYNGDDDMFSSDLSDDQLKMRLGHMSSTHCQVIFSMADEYVPDYVDKKALVERAMGGAEKVEIEYGNHSLSNRVEEAVDAIIDFLKREGPKGWDDPWS